MWPTVEQSSLPPVCCEPARIGRQGGVHEWSYLSDRSDRRYHGDPVVPWIALSIQGDCIWPRARVPRRPQATVLSNSSGPQSLQEPSRHRRSLWCFMLLPAR